MKRKILLFVSAVFCAFALCACGSTDNTDDYNGLTAGVMMRSTYPLAAAAAIPD